MMKRIKHFAKRPLALFLTLALTLSPVSLAGSVDYAGHWAEDSIEKAVSMGWFADGTATRPNDTVTRAEFVTMINRMRMYTGAGDLSAFSDVTPDDWYYGAFSAAVAAGYILGADGRLHPQQNITRNEAAVIFARLAELDTASGHATHLAGVKDAASIPGWAAPYVGAAIANGLIGGSDGYFSGNANLTRAETAVLLERLFDDIRVFGFAGTYGGTCAAAVVTAPGVLLEHMDVSGDLTIAESVGEGEVRLSDVAVGGALDVRGGGRNSVYLAQCSIASLTVTKDGVRVVLSDGTVTESAHVEGAESEILIDGSVTIEHVLIAETARSTKLVTEAGARLGTVAIHAVGTEITGGGGIESAEIWAADVVLEQTPGKLNLGGGITASVNGQTVSNGSNPSGGSGGGGK